MVLRFLEKIVAYYTMVVYAPVWFEYEQTGDWQATMEDYRLYCTRLTSFTRGMAKGAPLALLIPFIDHDHYVMAGVGGIFIWDMLNSFFRSSASISKDVSGICMFFYRKGYRFPKAIINLIPNNHEASKFIMVFTLWFVFAAISFYILISGIVAAECYVNYQCA